jgi:hypothetical protein
VSQNKYDSSQPVRHADGQPIATGVQYQCRTGCSVNCITAVERNWRVKVKVSVENSEDNYQNLRSGEAVACNRPMQIVYITTEYKGL